MEIQPLNETSTIQIPIKTTRLTTLSKTNVKDPDKIIPNGIYKVIKWENVRQMFTMALSLIIFAVSLVMTILYATDVMHVGWAGYIIPIILLIGSGYKLLITILENRSMKRAVERYKENLGIEINSTPAFVPKLYMSLHTKQIAHNWITFMFLFYGGIFTLLLWALKDVSWSIFEFKEWINNIYSNPDVMVWIATATLIFVAVMHIVFAIQRKKRVLEIDAYFGMTLITHADLEAIKQGKNKFWRRLFIISFMVILVLPIMVLLITKVARRRK